MGDQPLPVGFVDLLSGGGLSWTRKNAVCWSELNHGNGEVNKASGDKTRESRDYSFDRNWMQRTIKSETIRQGKE